ncbi:hypothetical protein GTO89_09465 [Heliobacterium gestii]|uniref:Uncharacterized protein n=1 Tax=Heliomicrobium gestii TaxID=2699 RepID=A0A845LK78_HELGE|nr:hypothetical protein [Heliomicrobium gestii]MBM7867923.1 hypothetical protein [Heliomicrobium gestii]MZP43266.1 hypothetical protein [Heliomicrobium gestii]
MKRIEDNVVIEVIDYNQRAVLFLGSLLKKYFLLRGFYVNAHSSTVYASKRPYSVYRIEVSESRQALQIDNTDILIVLSNALFAEPDSKHIAHGRVVLCCGFVNYYKPGQQCIEVPTGFFLQFKNHEMAIQIGIASALLALLNQPLSLLMHIAPKKEFLDKILIFNFIFASIYEWIWQNYYESGRVFPFTFALTSPEEELAEELSLIR